MKLIVGLGNPGEEYKNTRHNAGFVFIDQFFNTVGGEKKDFAFEKKFNCEIAEVSNKYEKIILAKPQTFMNLSGTAVEKILSFYKIPADDLIVVSDDVDLLVGQARIRHDGSSGGQKGLQNIIDNLSSGEFTRVRIGIGSDKKTAEYDTADYVLGKFSDDEKKSLVEINELIIKYLIQFLENGQKIPAHSLSLR